MGTLKPAGEVCRSHTPFKRRTEVEKQKDPITGGLFHVKTHEVWTQWIWLKTLTEKSCHCFIAGGGGKEKRRP